MSARICFRLLLLAPALAACHTSTAPVPIDPATRQELVAKETRKWDLLFGSKAQRDTVAAWFAPGVINVATTGQGVMRMAISDMATTISGFPQIPAGSFKVSDMQVVEPGDSTLVLSYRATGPGPTGATASLWVVSVWARRNGTWKTVFYQDSPGAV